MTHQRIIELSRRLSECEELARQLPYPRMLLDGLATAQHALGRMLAKAERRERDEP